MPLDLTQTRGYRNRNPGNIDYNPNTAWVGQLGIERPPLNGGKPRFARFDTHEHGIRAIAKLLQTYQDRYRLNTVPAIINRWAPPKENATSAYVRRVLEHSGFATDQVLDMRDLRDAKPVVEAIIMVEIGVPGDDVRRLPYTTEIDAGIMMAGVRNLTP